jgi:hypothetical protein
MSALRKWLALPLLCKLGLHFGRWKRQINFHSYHGVEVHHCERCPRVRSRAVSRRRILRRHYNHR